jgi:tRNA A37 threonylcarbamoyladenosine dehydratase
MKQFSRNLLTYGLDGQNILLNSRVLVLGLGGVGSFAAEALARAGVGSLIIIDKDVVDITNINRQLHATLDTIGLSKCDLMESRIKSINPDCEVIVYKQFFDFDSCDDILNQKIDFVLDASDTITYKILLIKECLKRQIAFISVMGTANKLDPSQFEITDIKNTIYDPIARIIRTKLKKERIKGKVPVVCSKERPTKSKFSEYDIEATSELRKAVYPPASTSFVPPVAGYIAVSYVIKELTKDILIERN